MRRLFRKSAESKPNLTSHIESPFHIVIIVIIWLSLKKSNIKKISQINYPLGAFSRSNGLYCIVKSVHHSAIETESLKYCTEHKWREGGGGISQRCPGSLDFHRHNDCGLSRSGSGREGSKEAWRPRDLLHLLKARAANPSALICSGNNEYRASASPTERSE